MFSLWYLTRMLTTKCILSSEPVILSRLKSPNYPLYRKVLKEKIDLYFTKTISTNWNANARRFKQVNFLYLSENTFYALDSFMKFTFWSWGLDTLCLNFNFTKISLIDWSQNFALKTGLQNLTSTYPSTLRYLQRDNECSKESVDLSYPELNPPYPRSKTTNRRSVAVKDQR